MKMNILALHDHFCQEAKLVRNLSPRTIKWYQVSLGLFLRYYKNRIVYLDEITTEKLREYLYSKRSSNQWTASSLLNQYKGIKSFLKWCVNRQYIDSNPIVVIEKPKLEKQLPKRITKQEAYRVVEYAFNNRKSYRFERYRNRAMLAVILYSGLRIQELLDLKVSHIDMDNRIINVVHGKGAKDRIVPMSSILYKYLTEYIDDKKRLEKDSEYMFVTLQGNKKYTYSGFKKMIAKIRKKTDINFTAHKLRHTFATLMLEGGCDLFSLQKMLGHSDIKTTTIYLSASVKHLQEQIVKHPMG